MTPDLIPTAALAELERAERASCADCRRAYGDASGFPDLVVPHDAWERIMPGRQGGGILCPSCMCKRAHDVGLSDVPAKFTSGPFAARHAHAQAEEIADLRRKEAMRCACVVDGDLILGKFLHVCQAHRERELRAAGKAFDAGEKVACQWADIGLAHAQKLTAQAARMRALEAVAAAATAHIAAMDPIDQGTTLVDIASALDALASEAKRGEGTTPA